jgi:hypothetical protein
MFQEKLHGASLYGLLTKSARYYFLKLLPLHILGSNGIERAVQPSHESAEDMVAVGGIEPPSSSVRL